MFGSKSLKCEVCKKLVDEFEWAIAQIPKDKKMAMGSFRMTSTGDIDKKMVTMTTSRFRKILHI